jgi:hypothetical protein
MDINPFVLFGNLAAAQSYDTRGPDEKRQHRAADLLPGHTAAHYNLGRVLRKSGQLQVCCLAGLDPL